MEPLPHPVTASRRIAVADLWSLPAAFPTRPALKKPRRSGAKVCTSMSRLAGHVCLLTQGCPPFREGDQQARSINGAAGRLVAQRVRATEKAPPIGSGAKFARSSLPKELAAYRRAQQRTTRWKWGSASAASHGRNAEPSRWFLCRAADPSLMKKPADSGASLFRIMLVWQLRTNPPTPRRPARQVPAPSLTHSRRRPAASAAHIRRPALCLHVARQPPRADNKLRRWRLARSTFCSC